MASMEIVSLYLAVPSVVFSNCCELPHTLQLCVLHVTNVSIFLVCYVMLINLINSADDK